LISASPVLDEQDNVVGGVMVQTDISDRVRAEAALREADRNKDEFLATLGHELRNPLAPIRTAVEILKRRQPADAVLVRAQQVIERQAEHMTRLVDDLLDVSRITRGLIRIRREPVTLQQAAAVAVEAALPGILAAGQRLEQEMPREPLVVVGDATRLSQMALNLLTNACKFTGTGGMIRLRLRRDGGAALIEVEDNGIGLSPESLERIFGLFVQEHPSGAGGSTGLGIGLALARQLARMHGGEIVAASAGLGQGSTFSLRLPLAGDAVTPPPVQAGPLSVATSAAPAPEPAPMEEAVLLVVDDNRDGCDVLCQLLEMSGFVAHAAYDGESAVALAAQLRPDAVVLDIGLPDVDGFRVCRRLREQFGAGLVLIALTGWGQPQDRQAAMSAGFDAHLTKPTDPEALGELLSRLLGARSLGLGQPELETGHARG
ncbi:MAG TPA: ATP-binding protein, partial [Ramlibacter sp.]|nr:ATP-binding protein [Ramlibacter sp.]